MKKLLIVFMAVSLFTACKDDKGAKSKDRKEVDSRDKDDYRSDDKTTDDRDKPGKGEEDTKSDGWKSSDERLFTTSCEGTATKNVGAARASEYCGCMLDKLKKMFSSYAEAETELSNPSRAGDVQRMADECNGQ